MQSMAMAQSPEERSDESLANLARAGDRDAFAALVGKYRDVVYAYAYARLRHRDEAEDIAQEAFVRAFVGLSQVHTTGCWAAWLMRIVRNLCHDAARRQRGRGVTPLDETWPDDAPTPEMFLLTRERGYELRKAIAELPDALRIPLLMHYVSRRTYREIALALELPETTVVGRLATALQRLRRRFRSEGQYER
jgi:RNA polymerase sigma-70 factor (ECF subfamily)